MSDFDWVTARSKCSPDSALKMLGEQIEIDVAKRNELLSPTEMRYGIKFQYTPGAIALRVDCHQSLGGLSLIGSAVFSQTEDGIRVAYRPHRDEIIGVLTLDNDGKCCIRVREGYDPLNFWQFRKLALEAVFFEATKGLSL